MNLKEPEYLDPFHFVDGEKIEGLRPGLEYGPVSRMVPIEKVIIGGDCTHLRGNCTMLWGDCTGLSGDCTGLSGDCTGLSGDCTGLSGDCTDWPRAWDLRPCHCPELSDNSIGAIVLGAVTTLCVLI